MIMGEVIERHQFTAQQYEKMVSLGIIDPEARVELIDGEIVAMSPANEPHEGMVRWLLNRLMPQVGQLATVDVQNAIALDERSRPEPDLMLLKPRHDAYRNRRPKPQDVLLLIEVADSSLQKDRTIKLPRYGRGAIPEVWIIDLEGRCVEIYRHPIGEGYGQSLVVRQGQIVCLALPEMVLSVDDLFA